MTFIEALREAVSNQELMTNYDRLRGTNLSLRGAPIQIHVDISSGRIDSELREFIVFFWACIWEPAISQQGGE